MVRTDDANANQRNAWRLAPPAEPRSRLRVRPSDPQKLRMISADCHANEPAQYLSERIPAEYAHRIPHMEVDDEGAQWIITEGTRPQLVKRSASQGTVQSQESY